MDAFLIPGGYGTRQELHNGRLHEYVRALPQSTLLTSVCTGSWVYGKMGLLDGLLATNRKEPDRVEQTPPGMTPIDIGFAIRADHKNPASPCGAAHRAQHPDRRVVGPMEVVDDKQNRRRLGEP